MSTETDQRLCERVGKMNPNNEESGCYRTFHVGNDSIVICYVDCPYNLPKGGIQLEDGPKQPYCPVGGLIAKALELQEDLSKA